jgi:TonB family protein
MPSIEANPHASSGCVWLAILTLALRRFDGPTIITLTACLALICAPLIATAQSSVVGHAAAGEIGNSPFIPEGRGICVRMVSPQYPAGVAAGVQEVVLRVVIDKNGQVRPLYRISGRRDFELEAMNAVRMWQYRPMMRDEQPIAAATNVEVKFVPGVPAGFVTHPSR